MLCTLPCTAEAGYKVGGWFELGVAAVEGVRFDARVIVMATQTGFKVGGRLEARLGVLDGSHVALGVESMADVGMNGFFRLGWATVPGFPMAATVEITDMPDERSPHRRAPVLRHRPLCRARRPHRPPRRLRGSQPAVAGFTSGANAMVDF